EDARAAGDTLREAAEKLRLKVVTVEAIDRAGQRPDGSIIRDLPASAALIQAVFDAETGIENDGLETANNGYVFYEVDGITPARDRELDEVREKVVADWTSEEAVKRLAAKASELEKRLKDGTSLEAIAEELQLEKQTKRGDRKSTRLNSSHVKISYAVF